MELKNYKFMNNTLQTNFGRIKSFYYWTYWFKGAWLCLILHKLGAKIVGYSLKPKRKVYTIN